MKTNRFTKSGLWRLFLLLALPLHFWAIFLALRDVEAMARRSTLFDAISFIAYILVIAFVETLFTFIVAMVLNLLLPRRWQKKQHILALASIGYTVAFWTILNQINYWQDYNHGYLYNWLTSSTHELWYGLMVVLAAVILVTFSVAFPLYVIDRFPQRVKSMDAFAERITVLSTLFILLDIAAGILVLYRNIG